ncbi:AmmeMemoRadiSam system radical SAM enzyme [Patescibacteria group bacterium]
MKKAVLGKKLLNKEVLCLACQRYCRIKDNKTGFCQTRLNQNGQLFSLTYGVINGIQLDPIEKKPLYHFYPGSQVASIGSYGCNYRCKQCLNHWCSWGSPATEILHSLKTKTENIKVIEPESFVNSILSKGYPGIAFTYNEPSIWPEYVYEVGKLAKEKGLFTVFITNGSWSKEALEYLAPVIDAVNIDIKGFFPKTYKKMNAFIGSVLEKTELVVKKYKILTELTTLIIPGINDSLKELESLTAWIVKELGKDIPWHLSRFDPNLSKDQEFQKIPVTSIKTLKKAYKIGKKAGLNYIYVWAPPKSINESLFAIESTTCPKCGKLVIKRDAWQPELIGVQKKGKKVICKYCKKSLNIII